MSYQLDKTPTIDLGRQGENLAQTVEIDVSSMLEKWPQATFSLLVKRRTDTAPYVAATTLQDNLLVWPVTASDTAVSGDGKLEVRAMEGDVIAKSAQCAFRVTASLAGTEEAETPEAAETWVNRVLGAAEELNQQNTQVIATTVSDWLDAHPEATTSLPDGAVSESKLTEALLDKINGKIDVSQGSAYAGQALVIGTDGKVIPGFVAGGGSGGAAVDATLSTAGLAADARATGLRLEQGLNEALTATIPENPLKSVRFTPGLMGVFRTVGVIGDSMASGVCAYQTLEEDGTVTRQWASLEAVSWPQVLSRATGNTYLTFTQSGATTRTWLAGTQAARCFNESNRADAYIIALGINDRGEGIPVGTAEDVDTADSANNADSFYGCYGKIISGIRALQPRAPIFVMTDPVTVDGSDYNAAVRAMADLFDGVYVVDWYAYAQGIYNDGLLGQCSRVGHYNAVGYYLIAFMIAGCIDSIMRSSILKGQEDFLEIEFIGTNRSYSHPAAQEEQPETAWLPLASVPSAEKDDALPRTNIVNIVNPLPAGTYQIQGRLGAAQPDSYGMNAQVVRICAAQTSDATEGTELYARLGSELLASPEFAGEITIPADTPYLTVQYISYAAGNNLEVYVQGEAVTTSLTALASVPAGTSDATYPLLQDVWVANPLAAGTYQLTLTTDLAVPDYVGATTQIVRIYAESSDTSSDGALLLVETHATLEATSVERLITIPAGTPYLRINYRAYEAGNGLSVSYERA